jgi:acyl carrier protein
MKDEILKYIIDKFGSSTPKERRTHHYSYCSFPEDACVCKDLNDISYDTPLISGGYIDSFSMVAVLVFLERTFGVDIPDKDATPTNFNTVNDMALLVNKYKK